METPIKQITLFSHEDPMHNRIILTMYDADQDYIISVQHFGRGILALQSRVETEVHNHPVIASKASYKWQELIDSFRKAGYIVPPERGSKP